jgi:DNA-binding NarL/FixJ family response regulator
MKLGASSEVMMNQHKTDSTPFTLLAEETGIPSSWSANSPLSPSAHHSLKIKAKQFMEQQYVRPRAERRLTQERTRVGHKKEYFAVKEIRVLLADDHTLIRGGIRALLEKLPQMQIVAEASNGPEALRLIKEHRPDVALIEGALSRLNGFEVTALVKKECPGVNVIILSTHADEECLRQVLGCGADGYLTMTTSAAQLELAIRTVANGQTHISSSAAKLLEDFVRGSHETLKGLTPRQREVLKLIAEGKSTKQIALALKISVKTVETHRTLLTDRLDIHHTAGLVRYAIKAGLIRLED